MRLIDADNFYIPKGFFNDGINVPKIFKLLKMQSTIDPATLAPKWISVEERLPNPRTVCLGYYKHSYCDNDGFWIISTVLFDGEKFKVGSDYKVTHWMELPEPPKRKGENDA